MIVDESRGWRTLAAQILGPVVCILVVLGYGTIFFRVALS